MNRKGILFILGFIALLALPTLVDVMSETTLEYAASFALAAYIAITIAILIQSITWTIQKRRNALSKGNFDKLAKVMQKANHDHGQFI